MEKREKEVLLKKLEMMAKVMQTAEVSETPIQMGNAHLQELS